MDNPVIYYVVGGLLILFFFYLTYQFTKTWRWLHVLFAFFVFGAAIALCIFVSASLRTHSVWRLEARDQTNQLAKEKSQRNDLLHGNLLEVVQTKPSLRAVTAEVRRVQIDRGRVWRGCQPAPPAADDTVTVSTVSAAPVADAAAAAPAGDAAANPAGEAPAAGAPASNHIEQGMILNVFVEGEPPAEENLPAGSKVPGYFIGEFSASAVTDTSVTLKPTSRLSPIDKQVMRAGNATWALYESMPVDGHRYFTTDPSRGADLTREADKASIFGDIPDALLTRLFQAVALQPLPPEQLAKLMKPYQRDGRRAAEDDSPEDIWLKVRFIQPYKEDVDTAGNPVGAVISSQMFFDRGRAEVALLRRGGPAEFKKGDVGLFPQEDARRLIDQDKVCELIEPVYVRPLNDYEFGFRNIAARLADLDESQRAIQRASAEVTAANDLVKSQIGYREQEREKVKTDLQKTQLERDRITEYAANLKTQWAKAREELSALYRTNSELAEQLVRLDQEMTEQINRRAAETVATPR